MTFDISAVAAQHTSNGGALSYRELATQTGLSWDAVRGRVRRYAHKHAGNGASCRKSPVSTVSEALIEQISAPAPTYEASNPTLDDTDRWNQWKLDRANNIPVRAMVWYDLHIPDHSDQALAVALDLAGAVQPDVIIFGGDMFDFDALSNFLGDPLRIRRDPYKEIASTWDRIIDNIMIALPRVKIVAFAGNHEDRRQKWWAKNGAVFYESNEELFVKIVRSNNRVWWLADTQETMLGELKIMHGERFGENACKNTLKQLGWAMPVMQGHNHQVGTYTHRVETATGYRIVQAMSVGCLCNIPPHYQKKTKSHSRWVHSVGIADVGLITGDVALHNAIFFPMQAGGFFVQWYGTRVERDL